MNIAVWGWADPGERIAVSLGSNTRETIAATDGNWSVSLAAMHAGGPFTLVVHGRKVVEVKDVLLGEVWIASGQSNMTYALSGAAGASEEIPAANYPQMRFFTAPKRIAIAPEENTLPAAWEICTPDTAKTFSAVAYFFGRDLHKALHVPIGLILSAWPGTAGEEWTDPDSLRREPVLRPIVQRWEALPAEVKNFAAEPTEISLEFDDFELLPSAGSAGTPTLLSNFDDGASRTETGGVWTYNWPDAAGTTFDLVAPGRGGTGYAARVVGKLDGASSSDLRASFKSEGSPADLDSFIGIRFWVRGKEKRVVLRWRKSYLGTSALQENCQRLLSVAGRTAPHSITTIRRKARRSNTRKEFSWAIGTSTARPLSRSFPSVSACLTPDFSIAI